MYLIDIFRTFHPNAEKYTFSSAHRTFSKIDHILGHKSNLSKFKKIEIISSIFSDHNALRLGINNKKNINRQPNSTPKTTGKRRTNQTNKKKKLVEGKKS